MKKTKLILASAGIVCIIVAVTTATASPLVSSTPLYTFRMEHACDQMNFLPTEMNKFTYTTEKGISLGYCTEGWCTVRPLGDPTDFGQNTCEPICTAEGPTCGYYTCPNTCPNTCASTCPNTCASTCPNTCPNTCNTCSTCEGQGYTCNATSCQNTCEITCKGYPTCDKSCNCPILTLEYTCEGFTCS